MTRKQTEGARPAGCEPWFPVKFSQNIPLPALAYAIETCYNQSQRVWFATEADGRPLDMKWYETSYRRSLCDMHIEDWDARFLSDFSPEQYYDNLRTARIQSPMLYFQSHVGHCYWPTRTGHVHAAFAEQPDRMRRLVDLCHTGGMDVICLLYTSRCV